MNSFKALAEATARAAQILKPPPKLTLSEWADLHAYLPDTSAKPGRFRTSFAEYQRGILDAISDPLTHTVAVMSSAQVGKTQALLCALGYYIDQDPSPILMVLPTVDDAKDFSKERLAASIRSTPRLRGKVATAKSRDQGNTQLHKEFPGGNITLAGANAPSRLASRPKRIVFCDEVDRYPSSAGTEGDPVTLAVKRTNTFWNRKVVLTSTPGTAGASRIEQAYNEGDQRRYWVPCPHCGHEQTLTWQQVKWNSEGGHQPETAAYACEECGTLWSDAERWAAIRKGTWKAAAPFRGVASFHLSELYSTFVELSKTVRDFLDAKDNAERLKVWTNTALGEPWAERGEAPDWQRLYEKRSRSLKLGTVPEWASVLTAGADVQRNRIEVDVWAWGPGLQSALVDHLVFDGDPAGQAVWDSLDEVLGQEWDKASGKSLRLSRLAIDTGDGYSTTNVYAWARKYPRQVMAVKGEGRFDSSSPVSGPTWVDATVNGKKLKKGVQLWRVAVSVFKSETFAWLNIDQPLDGQDYPNGFIHIPEGTGDEWIKQLVGEQLVTVRNRAGFARLEWQKTRDRNEALDMRVYARAAAYALGLDRMGARQWQRVAGEKPAPEPETAPVEVVAQTQQRRQQIRPARRSGWMGRLR